MKDELQHECNESTSYFVCDINARGIDNMEVALIELMLLLDSGGGR